MQSTDGEVRHEDYCIHCEDRDGVEHEERCTYQEPCEVCQADGFEPEHLLLRSLPVMSLFRS